MADQKTEEPRERAQEITIEGVNRVVLELAYDEVEKRDRVYILASDKNGHTVRQVVISTRVSPLHGAALIYMTTTY